MSRQSPSNTAAVHGGNSGDNAVALDLPGYTTIQSGHLYSKPLFGSDDPLTDPPCRVLFLCRVSYCEVDQMCEAIRHAARQALRLPGDAPNVSGSGSLLASLRRGPRAFLDELTASPARCRATIGPVIDASPEFAAAPVDCLHVLSGSAPGSLCRFAGEAQRGAAGSAFVEDAIRDPALRAMGYGFEWCANLEIRSGTLPRPWRVVSAYEGQSTDESNPKLRQRVDRQVEALYPALHAASSLEQVPDFTAAFRERFLTQVVEYVRPDWLHR